MGIFVEEAAAFIIGGLIGAALLFTKDTADVFKLILFILCLGLALFGILDVAVDHLGADETQTQTP